MDRITKLPLLDETGQEIASSLEEINNSMGDYIASNNPYYAYLEDRKIGTLLSTEITKVRDYGLYERESLMAIDLPKCVSVGEEAFYYCTALSNVNLPKCITIGMNAFDRCQSLESIELPECVDVGDYAFSLCEKLQNVNIPKCTIINQSAFQFCNFKKIDLNVVEKIESSAFWNCKLLECVKLLNTETVCALADKDAFSSTPIANGTGYIYVPDALVNDYKKATNWSVYANQIKPLSEYVESEA